ncbi:hypothetical protein VTK26DRAFT_7490 [Humicola hyalothermophila]
MAFHTSIFRGGEWVTERVDLHAILKSQTDPKPPTQPKPPQCGLLTKTVVESARANWILPARLRSPENNDIAFVGDYFVQICELRQDGRLKEIARKNDLGCRIRNACAVGSFTVPELEGNVSAESASFPGIKTEAGEPGPFGLSSPSPRSSSTQLPPQLLAVVLETGECVFLFLRPGPEGMPEFVASRFGRPRLKSWCPGFHVAVNPSSRYMALASAADSFVVYELESREQLNQSYLLNEPLKPVKSFRLRSVHGVIHSITFLYPRPGDDHHIVLLLVIVRNGKSRAVIYDWELGDNLHDVFAEEKPGHRMPLEHQMPLLVVPLTVQSNFIVVSPTGLAMCSECLYGPPKYETIPIVPPGKTRNHRGHETPLWTAWARPSRCRAYSRDCIYLAREDGLVAFMQVDAETDTQCAFIDPLPCDISRAFACLFDQCTDVLMVGSDLGSGSYWKIIPREAPEMLGTLPNWSPVVDFATTDDFTDWHQGAPGDKSMEPWQQAKLRKPDRIFATCDGPGKGSITEYRYGLKANIGLDLEYGDGLKRAWLLPSQDTQSGKGYLLLLSMPDRSAALFLPHDFSSAKELDADTMPYGLASTTLALACSAHLTVQVTKETVVLVAQDRRSARFPVQELEGLSNASVSDVCVLDDCIAVSAHIDARFQIAIFRIDTAALTLAQVQTIEVDGEVTCMSIDADYTLLLGIRKSGQTILAYGSLRGTCGSLESVNLTEHLAGKERSFSVETSSPIEGIESIVSIQDTVLLGTRSGEVISLRNNGGRMSISCDKFGITTATLTCGRYGDAADPTILLSCDNNLISIGRHRYGSRSGGFTRLEKFPVWPVDASKPGAPPPPVQYAVAVDMPSEGGITPILMISGPRLLLAEMHQQPGPAHRSIPVDGIPNRIIYCRFTQCLVAAVTRDDRPTLLFINPDTGADIGCPTDKMGNPQDFISGLGKQGDRIMGLTEWKYRKDGTDFNFILVTTKGGRLVVISTGKFSAGKSGRGGSVLSIRYWTRFKKEFKEPIYSIIGYDEGVIYCLGQKIQREVLDTEERKLKPVQSFDLGSPATSLRISNGKLLALTSRESLVVLDHLRGGEDDTLGGAGNNNNSSSTNTTSTAKLCHADPGRRNGIHFIEVAGPRGTDDPTDGIVLIADRECGVGGLWVPWQNLHRECEVVLEAELRTSIRRFRRGRTRPVWTQPGRLPKYGRLPATADDAEILGVSLDGALHQLTLLRPDAWRLLKFVEMMASASDEVCPLSARTHRTACEDGSLLVVQGSSEELPKPDGGLAMHVDGDVLQRCLERRALERVLVRPTDVKRLVQLLGKLDGGRHTEGLRGDEEGEYGPYFRLAYEVLEYYLQPVL